MKNKFIYIAILLTIPLLTLLVINLCEMSINSELFDMASLCSEILIITAVLYSIILLILGLITSINRSSLLLVFKPFFYLSTVVLSIFTIINGVLLVALLFFGESYLIGRVHFIAIGMVGIGAVSGTFIILKSMLSTFQKTTTTILGISLSKEKCPKVWDYIGLLATKLNTELPNNIIAGLDPNFFVTEVNVKCLDGELCGRTLYISLPLLRLLNLEQFNGVIGHEFGHFIGKDTRYSKHFYPIYRGLFDTLNNLQNSTENSIAILPTQLMLTLFLNTFSKAESKLSRERELLADQIGVQASNEYSFASALVRIVTFASFWQSMQEKTKEIVSQEQMLVNMSDYFAKVTPTIITDEVLDGLSFESIPHPTDSHPPINQRIECIGFSLKGKVQEFTNMIIKDCAIELIDEFEKIECELSESYQSILSRDLKYYGE